MMKNIWTGNIQFGQKKIGFTLRPVAAAEPPVPLRIVHACGQRIRQQKYCPDCGDVSAADVNKAYESAGGQLYPVSKKQLEACTPASRRSLAIEQFASLSEFAHMPKSAVYFMEPIHAERHDYHLLYESLAQLGKCAVTRIVIRGLRREQLAIVRPWEQGLCLETLFYKDELQAPPEPLELTQLKPEELAASSHIVAAGTRPFDHSLYKDRFRETLTEMLPKAGLADTHLVPEVASATLLPEPRKAPAIQAVHCDQFAGEDEPPVNLHVHIAAMVRGTHPKRAASVSRTDYECDWLSEHDLHTLHNGTEDRAEVLALLEAIRKCPDGSRVIVHTNSTYLSQFKKRCGKSGGSRFGNLHASDSPNGDLWQQYAIEAARVQVEFTGADEAVRLELKKSVANALGCRSRLLEHSIC